MGIFVPNISFGPLVIEAVRGVTNLHLDVHLMVSQPEQMMRRVPKPEPMASQFIMKRRCMFIER